MIADAIAHPVDVPMEGAASVRRPASGAVVRRPGTDRGRHGRCDNAAAGRRGAGLDRRADRAGALGAAATLAGGRVALLDGDLDRAIDEATTAIAAWSESIGAPFEAAAGAARCWVKPNAGQATPDAAHMEWRAAQSAFEAFGAVRWAAHAGDLLTDHASASPPVRSGRTATATFRCEGDTRRICFGELTVLIRDLKGFRYLERLLADPGREFHVLDLVAVEQGSLPTGATTGPGEIVASDAGAGLPLLDDQARQAYRRRLAEVDDDIEDATRMNDLGRVELAQRDREYLIAELTAAAGLGGRNRTTGGTAERARTSVARSIRYAAGTVRRNIIRRSPLTSIRASAQVPSAPTTPIR